MKKNFHPFMRFIEGPGSGEVTQTASGEPNGTTVVSATAPSTTIVEPSYVEEDLNKQIVKVRPQDTPIDTFTRSIANDESCKSWEAGGWEIGTRETRDKVATAYVAGTSTANQLVVSNIDMWKPGDTFIVNSVSNGKDTGPMGDGTTANLPVQCLVKSVDAANNKLVVQRVGSLDSSVTSLPSIAKDYILQRLSPAVSELEASVEGYSLQPSSRRVYNQTHMCQVEESVIHSLLKKKVAMDFSVYKEQTIWDFKRGMELCNLFGVGGLSKNAKGELVHLSTGLWWQMTQQSEVPFWQENGVTVALTDQKWNAIAREIFEGNNGADRRLLFAGNGLLEQLANAKSYQKQIEAKNTEMVLGLRVFKIETPFGELLVKPMGSLFDGYYSDCGMVIDPNFVKKYIMEPLQTTNLDLNKTGQRRVDNAVRIHETYSLFLENLPTHRLIVPQYTEPQE